MELIGLAGEDRFAPTKLLFWFQSNSGQVLLCEAPQYTRISYMRERTGCWSARQVFAEVNGKWTVDPPGSLYSFTFCH